MKTKKKAKHTINGIPYPKSDIGNYKKFIITDKDRRPMAWGSEQLCYCTTSDWQDTQFPLKVYTRPHANRLITLTQIFRRKNKFGVESFLLIPVQ